MKSNLAIKTVAGFFAIMFLTSFMPASKHSPIPFVKCINGSPVVFTQVVHMDGSEEVPPVDTDAKGIAILRVTEDMKLYSKVLVMRLDPATDGTLTAAHIHPGAAGTNGPPIIFLAHDESEFGQNMVQQLTTEQYNAILNDALYVNAHTTVHPSGIIRAQIR